MPPAHRPVPAAASLVVVMSLSLAALTACTGGTTTPPVASGSLPQSDEPVELDPAQFTVDIDNPYWPMQPGTRWTYRELDADGTQLDVVVTVTSETKTIANGVEALVVRDTVSRGDEIELWKATFRDPDGHGIALTEWRERDID